MNWLQLFFVLLSKIYPFYREIQPRLYREYPNNFLGTENRRTKFRLYCPLATQQIHRVLNDRLILIPDALKWIILFLKDLNLLILKPPMSKLQGLKPKKINQFHLENYFERQLCSISPGIQSSFYHLIKLRNTYSKILQKLVIFGHKSSKRGIIFFKETLFCLI